jgi:putative integral membrane protein (TIGR02587 family)
VKGEEHSISILGRAFAGAIIFAFPVLLTMEMWWFGFYVDRARLALFLLLGLPLVFGLSHFSGYSRNFTFTERALDTLVSYAVGFAAAAVLLGLIGELGPGVPMSEVLGKIGVQTLPAAVGAVFSRSLLDSKAEEEESKEHQISQGREIFLRVVGAFVLGFTAAPTEEMVIIGFKMTPWHSMALVLVSVIILHAFIHTVELNAHRSIPAETPGWSLFLRYTVVGYATVLVVSGYILWTFGRFDGMGLSHVLTSTVILAFPATLGAAAVRVLL